MDLCAFVFYRRQYTCIILCCVYFLLVIIWLSVNQCNRLPGKTRFRNNLLCAECMHGTLNQAHTSLTTHSLSPNRSTHVSAKRGSGNTPAANHTKCILQSSPSTSGLPGYIGQGAVLFNVYISSSTVQCRA